MNRESLYKFSISQMLAAQSEWGSFVAAPTFPTYNYCWYRDSGFIAHALSVAGEVEAASRFHTWAAKTLLRNSDLISDALDMTPVDAVRKGLYLSARYELHGATESKAEDGKIWPNFQLDGLGTWIWSLLKHTELHGIRLSEEQEHAVQLSSKYLAHFWTHPCFDYWEEHSDGVHASTLISIRAGLHSAKRLVGAEVSDAISEIDEYLSHNILEDGIAKKSNLHPGVDSSTLGFIVPFGTTESLNFDPSKHFSAILESLGEGVGLRRYLGDTFYGGGQWVLLTAWAAWAAHTLGHRLLGNQLLEWVESKADEDGNLPEQVADLISDSAYLEEWEHRWGSSANPLTWSHAMYVIAVLSAEQSEQ